MDVEQAMKIADEQLALIDSAVLPTPQAKRLAVAFRTLAAEVRRLRIDTSKCGRCGSPATCGQGVEPRPRCADCDAKEARDTAERIIAANAAAEAARERGGT